MSTVPRPLVRNAVRSSARTSTRSWTRSTTCWKRTRKTSYAHTCKRVASKFSLPPPPNGQKAGMEHTPFRAMPGAPLPAAYTSATSSSFMDFLRVQAPHLLPGSGGLDVGQPVRARQVGDLAEAPHGTTIVAATFDGGVLIAGDRRATS